MPSEIIISTLIFRLIVSAIAVLVAIIIIWILGKFFRRYKKPTDEALKSKSTAMLIFYSILKFVILLMLILFILSVFGVNVSGAIAGLGIVGAAAVFALQDLLKDFIMGVTIISDHFFSIGDIVDYNGTVGKVISLTMRSTKIRSLKDDSVLSVQNHRISEIKVLSHMVNILVPLPYDLPVAEASEVLEKICVRSRQLPNVEACVSKGATEFNDSSISYLIILSCDPASQLNTRRSVLRVIQEELEAAGIQIPFPQIDVHEK